MALRSKAVSLSAFTVTRALSSAPSLIIFSKQWVSKGLDQPPTPRNVGTNASSKLLWQRVPKSLGKEKKKLKQLQKQLDLAEQEAFGKKPLVIRNLRSYAQIVVNRMLTEIGASLKLAKKKRRNLAKPSVNPSRHQTSLVHLDRLTRQIKLLRLWFLDYHVMGDIAVIIHQILRDNRLGKKTLISLDERLRTVVHSMTENTSSRHLEEYSNFRQDLFKIADGLREYKSKYMRMARRDIDDQDNKPPLFPSSRLTTLETNLLIGEVLCKELVARKVLLNGPDIVRNTLRQLRELGYEPKFKELPDLASRLAQLDQISLPKPSRQPEPVNFHWLVKEQGDKGLEES
ncbi:hypothetical protein F5Y03DRAFT_369907 [Xylaria venustula]|nr:hypothetical protein F5Y03DRAFT_369907 [Xylaria venustula]